MSYLPIDLSRFLSTNHSSNTSHTYSVEYIVHFLGSSPLLPSSIYPLLPPRVALKPVTLLNTDS